jgi:serine/threonine protein kinase
MTRYELLERIGAGGMAEIFRGVAVAGGGFEKPVAIKRILPHLSQDERFVELLITEAKTLSELRHRNVVQIFDVGLGDDGQYFLVMEFVDGLDLADLFEILEGDDERLPLDAILYIGAEVCDALEHAHNARDADGQLVGLVHRDVSPSNILLSKSGQVKLTDFGIAKRMEEMTGHGSVRGKFAYLSPEQANNIHVDGRSDVCSLGMVLFELLTGKRLLSDKPDFDALRAVREHKIPRLREVDPSLDEGLEDLLMKAIAADPADRYQSAEAFAVRLREHRYQLPDFSSDPVQLVARIVRDGLVAVSPVAGEASTGEQQAKPDIEPTVVRIHSAAGFRPVQPDEDPFDQARQALDDLGDETADEIDDELPDDLDDDDDDDDKTKLGGDLGHELPPPPAVEIPEELADDDDLADELDDDDKTQLGGPDLLGPTGTFRPAPPAPVGRDIDPDADTELALLSPQSRVPDGLIEDDDDDADFPTRQFDRNDPIIAAAIRGQARRTGRSAPPPAASHAAGSPGPVAAPRRPGSAPPTPTPTPMPAPPPSPPSPPPPGSAQPEVATQPRPRLPPPRRPIPSHAISLPTAYPRANPETLRQINYRRGGRILGMPRQTAYWVLGAAAAVVLAIIVGVAAAGGDATGAADRDAGAPLIDAADAAE